MVKVIGVAVLVAVGFCAGVVVTSQATPKKAYMLVQVDVTNPQQYQEYAARKVRDGAGTAQSVIVEGLE